LIIFIYPAKELIKHYKETNPDCLPWKNRQCFQDSVKIKNIENFNENSYGFFDRSIVDEHGFRSYYGLNIPDNLKRICEDYRYDKVFIFKPWKQIFINNEYRKITFDECVELDKHIIKEYKKFNYEPIEIINSSK